MEFRIADTFTASLGRLAGEEQKAAKITAFELQMDPAQPGMRFHRIDGAKDRNFWSVRVSRDLRLIVHKFGANLLLCYVDHHDAAYRWAERRRLENHPRTGAAQIVEIREKVLEIEVPRYIEVETIAGEIADDTRRIFDDIRDDELLGCGVPVEWLDDLKQATEESLLDLSDHLPAEAAEALLDLAKGYEPQEIGVFVRSDAELERAIKGIEDAGLSAVHLSTHPGGVSGSVAAGTMHLAKGLEFRAVVVAACDDEILPLQSRIESIADEADLEEVYETERHLLYVACTRARDRLLVTGVDPASEFLDDLHVLT